MDIEIKPINILLGANGAGKSNFLKDCIAFRAGELPTPHARELQLYHFCDTSYISPFNGHVSLDDCDFLRRNAKNIAAFLYRLKNNYEHEYQQIVRAVRTVAPSFKDFFLYPRGDVGAQDILLRWFGVGEDREFYPHCFSDGTARFVCLATLFLQPKELRPSMIVVDEPELGLHPVALEVLADIMKSISRECPMVCATQSVAFANFFGPEDFIIVERCDGVSTFSRTTTKQVENWIDDYQMGDLWYKNILGGRLHTQRVG